MYLCLWEVCVRPGRGRCEVWGTPRGQGGWNGGSEEGGRRRGAQSGDGAGRAGPGGLSGRHLAPLKGSEQEHVRPPACHGEQSLQGAR